jgi:hypothetical protein
MQAASTKPSFFFPLEVVSQARRPLPQRWIETGDNHYNNAVSAFVSDPTPTEKLTTICDVSHMISSLEGKNDNRYHDWGGRYRGWEA